MENHTLKRSLTVKPLVFIGLAYMAPMVVFTTYGVAIQASQGMITASYILALIAMLFTVYSYSKMIKAYPASGSVYTYTQKAIHPNVGFLVGWIILIAYLLTPMLNYLLIGIYLSAAFPSIPYWIWPMMFIAAITVINIIGVQLTANINYILVSFQLLVLVIFTALSIQKILEGEGTGTIFSSVTLFNSENEFALVVAGASLLFLSFLGFDALATFAEETVDATRTIPKAMYIVILIGGGLFITVSYITHMVYPYFSSFQDVDSAAFEIVQAIGGSLFEAIFLAGYITSCVASAIASHASASRFLFGMGRDGVLPKKVFGYVNPKFRTPVLNILFVSLLGLLAFVFDLDLVLSIVNFSLLTAFTFVNVSVIAHYYIKKRIRSLKGTLSYLVVPVIGCSFTIWLWFGVESSAQILGIIWVIVGVFYLVFLTGFFHKKAPELTFEDSETF